MVQSSRPPIGQDKLKSAIKALAELTFRFPDKSRRQLLEEIELKYDLSPLDCEFLHRHLDNKR